MLGHNPALARAEGWQLHQAEAVVHTGVVRAHVGQAQLSLQIGDGQRRVEGFDLGLEGSLVLPDSLLVPLGCSLGLPLSITLMWTELPLSGYHGVQGGTGVNSRKLESRGPGSVFLLPLDGAASPPETQCN